MFDVGCWMFSNPSPIRVHPSRFAGSVVKIPTAFVIPQVSPLRPPFPPVKSPTLGQKNPQNRRHPKKKCSTFLDFEKPQVDQRPVFIAFYAPKMTEKKVTDFATVPITRIQNRD